MVREDTNQGDGDKGYAYKFERGNKFYELHNHLGNVLVTVTDRLLQVPLSTNATLLGSYEADVATATDYYPFGMAMPGRNGKTVTGGGWASGTTKINGVSISETLTLDTRTNNTPTEYKAATSIEFIDGFTSGSEDEFVALIADATNSTTNGNGTGSNANAVSGYRYGFNKMEKDNEIKGEGNSYDFGARIYDPRLGRWLSLDPLMEKYPALSPYNFCANNPIIFIDMDGKDFILSTNYTYDGVASPTSIHQLGGTSLNKTSPLALAYNTKTKEFDFTLNVNVQFTSNFTASGGGSMEKENPGLYREVKAHEDGHVQQFFEAAKKSTSVTINIGGKPVTYSGRPDQILTKAYNAFDVKLKAETQTKINNGEFKTQAEVDAYQKAETDKFMTTTFTDLRDKVIKKIGDNLKTGMTGDKETDANKRAEKKLGTGTIKYNNGKTPVKYKGKQLR